MPELCCFLGREGERGVRGRGSSELVCSRGRPTAPGGEQNPEGRGWQFPLLVPHGLEVTGLITPRAGEAGEGWGHPGKHVGAQL